MDKFDRKYFGLRQQDTIHESSLTEVRETNSIDDLIDIVYNHQRASFRLNFTEYSKELEEEDIAHYFYKNCYIPNELYTGHDGYKTTTKKFVKYLFGNDIKGKNNKIHFLLGEVGSGKTSLINYIITNCLPRSVAEGRLLFVRIDLNLEDFEKDIDVKRVLKKLVKKLKRIIKKNPEIYSKREFWTNVKKCVRKHKYDYETQFAEIVKLIRSDRHLLIIFDNLDSIVHHNDRGAFKKFENTRLKEIRKIAFDFVNKFHSDNGAFSDLGAFVLFVMRNSTYGRINNFAKHSGSTKKFVNNTNCHTIIKQGWKEVVTTRNSLFQYAINKYDVIDDEDKEMLDRFREMMENGKDKFPLALKSINNLANKQLRDLVEYLTKYIWINYNENYGNLKTVLSKEPLTTISFMLGGMRLYSEHFSHFPNIYSINGLSNLEFEPEFKLSYWLKRLILNYFRKRSSQAITVNDLIADFETYDQEIIQDCLGSLTDVLRANLLQINTYYYNEELYNSQMSLTSRAFYCLDNIFDKFIYFQLMIDDFNLPLHLITFEENNKSDFDTSSANDYSYLTEHLSDGKELLFHKTKQVFHFLGMLKGALEAEKIIHDATFKNLENLGVEIPNIDKIKENIIAEIRSLSKKFPKGSKEKILNILQQNEIYYSRYQKHVKDSLIKIEENRRSSNT